MKAVRIHGFGGSDLVRVEEIAVPELKANEALIQIRAAAVNPVDWIIREGEYKPEGMGGMPLTLGQDFAGVIEKIAPGSKTSLKVGDAVFGETWGSFAEYAGVPLKELVRKPEHMDFNIAASIPMPALTAWQMVIDTANAKPGMKFLIHGASGGVGSFAAQFAKWKGAQVIATASHPSFNYLRSIGVDEIIDYKNEHFEEKVKNADVVIDPKGGDLQKRSWSVLKKGGMLINLVGEIDDEAARKAGVQGVMFGMEYNVEQLKQITKLIEKGMVKPHISQVFPLMEARQALDLNQQGKSHGKIILKVA